MSGQDFRWEAGGRIPHLQKNLNISCMLQPPSELLKNPDARIPLQTNYIKIPRGEAKAPTCGRANHFHEHTVYKRTAGLHNAGSTGCFPGPQTARAFIRGSERTDLSFLL